MQARIGAKFQASTLKIQGRINLQGSGQNTLKLALNLILEYSLEFER